MRRIVLTTLFISIIAISSFAQKQVNGKVFDIKSNAPLAGATIALPGKKATVTDKEGRFSFDCSTGNAITVSFVGYETRIETVRNCDDEIIIGLLAVNRVLDE